MGDKFVTKVLLQNMTNNISTAILTQSQGHISNLSLGNQCEVLIQSDNFRLYADKPKADWLMADRLTVTVLFPLFIFVCHECYKIIVMTNERRFLIWLGAGWETPPGNPQLPQPLTSDNSQAPTSPNFSPYHLSDTLVSRSVSDESLSSWVVCFSANTVFILSRRFRIIS